MADSLWLTVLVSLCRNIETCTVACLHPEDSGGLLLHHYMGLDLPAGHR
jgi:hypothetical protein